MDGFESQDTGRHENRNKTESTTARQPIYVDLYEARAVLAGMGIQLTQRQMRRAAETDAQGRRKLPFFIDPIDGRLKIERQALIDAYRKRQIAAMKNVRDNFPK